MITYVPDALFPSSNLYDIPDLRLDRCARYLDLPFVQWGSTARYREMRGTYGFYVDDSIFEPVWARPDRVFASRCRNIVEPNFSVTPETPSALAIWNTYRKRWLSRWWQENGTNIIVDLCVAVEYTELNLIGVPRGWSSFSTRGYADQPGLIGVQYDRARWIAGDSDHFLFIVYGGGSDLRNMYPDHKNIIWTSALEDDLDQGRGVHYLIGAGFGGQRVTPLTVGWKIEQSEVSDGR